MSSHNFFLTNFPFCCCPRKSPYWIGLSSYLEAYRISSSLSLMTLKIFKTINQFIVKCSFNLVLYNIISWVRKVQRKWRWVSPIASDQGVHDVLLFVIFSLITWLNFFTGKLLLFLSINILFRFLRNHTISMSSGILSTLLVCFLLLLKTRGKNNLGKKTFISA